MENYRVAEGDSAVSGSLGKGKLVEVDVGVGRNLTGEVRVGG